MSKPHTTRTLGPIHFEDLDPHRFEDLIRQLAYDFRQWQSIESTGRGGGDDGFDVRAYEVNRINDIVPDDADELENIYHPMEGNLWMIQCKREKTIGPKKLEGIIEDTINADEPPYGYILAAPTNFSKAAHDRFREKLRQYCVMEFYIWGAGELEDMLYQPKNDHILFAFFGISLTSRRRSRTTEIRATVGAKNKLIRILGADPAYKTILLRDLEDTNYPYEVNCQGFDDNPRWIQYSVEEFHPLGIVVSIGRYYAYIDKIKKEWDFSQAVNNVVNHAENERRDVETEAEEKKVKGFWQQIPHTNKAMLVENGLIRFDSIAFIDEKGDSDYECPHLFMDFYGARGPISGVFQYLEISKYSYEHLDEYERCSIFPKNFTNPKFGNIYRDKFVEKEDVSQEPGVLGLAFISIYDFVGKYSYLKPTDVIKVRSESNTGENTSLIKITSLRLISGKEVKSLFEDKPLLKQQLERRNDKELKEDDQIRVIEAVEIYDWQIEQNRPVI